METLRTVIFNIRRVLHWLRFFAGELDRLSGWNPEPFPAGAYSPWPKPDHRPLAPAEAVALGKVTPTDEHRAAHDRFAGMMVPQICTDAAYDQFHAFLPTLRRNIFNASQNGMTPEQISTGLRFTVAGEEFLPPLEFVVETITAGRKALAARRGIQL
jgi:hypothetical protein